MIPKLNPDSGIKPLTERFLNELEKKGFSGDIHTDYGTRLVMSTDNSIYEVLPDAVLYPANSIDIQYAMQLSSQKEFQQITFSARGGGTGTNGQSLNNGIIIDVSKYLNQIIEINPPEQYAIVQPGVSLEQLNREAQSHNLFFAPHVSPGNRATIGGMVNTDACGKGSRLYGRTSQHVLELNFITSQGLSFKSFPMRNEELEVIKNRKDQIGDIHRLVESSITSNKALIQKQFPKNDRFMTGYNLAHVQNEGHDFNLIPLIAGSEGTLVIVDQIKVKLTKIPSARSLIAIAYSDFGEALKDARALVEQNPSAIETIDENIILGSKKDPIWNRVQPLLGDELISTVKALNLIEFTSDDPDQLSQTINTFIQDLTQRQIKHYKVFKSNKDISLLWQLRKNGVGLLAKMEGPRKPVPFIEDTAVPPECLADYIKGFREILDRHQLNYGMFGHIDVGCLHVRPALDMTSKSDEKLIRVISNEVCELVKRFNGLMWAEHGRGYRSEFTEEFFGPELHQVLRQLKETFDPHNQLNPGKITTPASMNENVPNLDEVPMRGNHDRQVLPEWKSAFPKTLDCNGNAACFDTHPDSFICPTSKITRDRLQSPKGRAGILREWLRLLSLKSTPASQPEDTGLIMHLYAAYDKFKNALAKHENSNDFSHEVFQALDGCVSCKACKSDCPVEVNIPHLKAQFLNVYHKRYLRPPLDHLIANSETLTWMQSQFPVFFRWLMTLNISRTLLSKIGLCDAPSVSSPTLVQRMGKHQLKFLDQNELSHLSDSAKERSVILLQDAFTSFYEPELVEDTFLLLRELGYKVFLAPYFRNGKPFHVKGFINSFHKIAQTNIRLLNQLSESGIPLIGLEPSIQLTYRDEYQVAGFLTRMRFKVQLLQEWLTEEVRQGKIGTTSNPDIPPMKKYGLFSHCSEKACSPKMEWDWVDIFKHFGLKLEVIETGCCGMAGTFGHEVKHKEESDKIYQLSWKQKWNTCQSEDLIPLVTGFSCRFQIERQEKAKPTHPASALLEIVKSMKNKVL